MPIATQGNTATVLLVNEALFGAPASVNDFYTQRFELDKGFYDAAAYANHMAELNFAGVSDADLATRVLNNALGQDGQNNPVLNATLTQLFTTYHADRGVVIYQAALALAGLEADPGFGPAAHAWVARLNADAERYAPPGVEQQMVDQQVRLVGRVEHLPAEAIYT